MKLITRIAFATLLTTGFSITAQVTCSPLINTP